MLSVKNEKVLQFYKTHSYINFETANILLVDLLEKVLQKNDDNREDVLLSYLKKIDTEFNTVSNSVTDLKENVKQSSLSIVNLQTTLSNIPTTMTDNLTTRLTSPRENQVKELERLAMNHGANHILLNARNNIVDFYRSLNYEVVGPYTSNIQIPHSTMKKDLS